MQLPKRFRRGDRGGARSAGVGGLGQSGRLPGVPAGAALSLEVDEEDLARAIGHFEQSVRLDPSYAAAYAGLSHAWWWRGIWGATTFKQVESPSRAAAVKALELDRRSPGSACVDGAPQVRSRVGLERRQSRTFTRALAIDPNNVDAHFFSAMLCMALGCFRRSIAQ